MSASHSAQSRGIWRFGRINAVQASSDREKVLGVFSDYVVSVKDLAEEEDPVYDGKMVPVDQARFKNSITGSSGFIEDTMPAFVNPETYVGISTADNQLEAILHGLFNMAIHENV